MKKNKFISFKKISWQLIALTLMVIIIGCSKDEDPMTGGTDPVASFQFEVNQSNFFEVSFTNFSQNATSYSWNFGDGNSSVEKDPTHTYSGAGTFMVTLTASNSTGESATRTETINITDPNALLTLLAGSDSKIWYLNRENISLGIGPNINDNAWWSFGGVTPHSDRPCILDDQYTFHRDGTFEFNSGGTLFVDLVANGGWIIDGVDAESCHDESESDIWGDNSDRSAFGSGGDYTYDFDNVTNSLTLNGMGAYIGLANKTADGDNNIPIGSKTYSVFNLAEGDIADTLSLAIVGDGFVWNFYLVSYEDPNDLPELIAQPRAAFTVSSSGLEASFTNQSANATSYSWDFGDGGMSSEANPTYTYGASGDYDVTLTAMDNMGQSDFITKKVSVSDASFTADVMSNDAGKVWRLAGEGSYKVGPGPGAGDWWGGLDAAGVIERACQMDDEFIFSNDGSMVFDSKGQVWAEDYMGGAFMCTDDSALSAPFNAFGSGTHAFDVFEENGVSKVRVMGTGAYIGFNKPYNGGELPNDGSGMPVSEITYDVIGYVSTNEREVVTLAIDYVGDGCCYWTITIENLK